MPTDDERREVARRLREFADDYGSDGVRSMDSDEAFDRLFDAIGFDYRDRANWVYLGGESPDLTPAYARRLADLIEPGEPKARCVAEVKVDGERLEKLAHDAAEELTGIDRDALLEEVKELERCAWYFGLDFDEDEPLRDRLKEASEDFAGSARRIRDALGVTDG